MPQTKYLTFKAEDAQKYLGPQQKQNLMEILQAIAAGRLQDGKSVGDLMFVLNLKDQFAQEAIEAYIAAIHRDGTAVNSPGVQAALDVAVNVRATAMLTLTPRLPD